MYQDTKIEAGEQRQETIQKSVDAFKGKGFYLGAESIMAITELYNVCVSVWHRDGNEVNYRFTGSILQIYYASLHYEAIASEDVLNQESKNRNKEAAKRYYLKKTLKIQKVKYICLNGERDQNSFGSIGNAAETDESCSSI